MISQLQLASDTLTRLRGRGFQIALDGFGSGYSSLRYLADMPVDVVKFDISLVHAMCEDTARGRMLRKLVGLLKEPGYKLVAKGVESDAIANAAQRMGFDLGQGFLLGKPVIAIRSGNDRVEVECEDGTRLDAEYAIVTLPFSVLRNIRVEPGFEALQQEAVNELPYTAITKYFLVPRAGGYTTFYSCHCLILPL